MNFPGAGGGGASPSGIDPNDPNMKRMAALMESCYAKTVMSGVMGFGLGGVFGMFMASMAYDTPYHTPTAANTPAPAAGAAATSTATGSATAVAGKAAPTATQTAPSTSLPHSTSTATSTIPKPPSTVPISSTTSAPATIPLRPSASPLAAATQAGALAAGSTTVPLTSLPLKQQLAIGFRDMGSRSWSSAKNFGKVGALFSGIECGIEGLRAKNDIGNGVAAGCVTGAVLARNAGPQAAALGCAGFAAFSAAIEAYMRQPSEE